MKDITIKQTLHYATYTYITFMYSIFLLLFHDFYFDIQDTKFQWFLYASVIYIAICIIGAIALILRKQMNIKQLYSSFSFVDIGMLIFLTTAFIAYQNSVDRGASWNNESGRHMGLLFYIVITCVYFSVSRNFKVRKGILNIFLGTIGLVSMLALLNFFDIDPFGFYANLSDYQSSFYLSTIGNTNYIGSLICLSFPISFTLFCYSKKRASTILYASSLTLVTLLLLCANADSGYLGGVLFLIIFLYIVIKNPKLLKRYLLGLLLMIVVARILGVFSYIFTENCRPFFTLSYFLTQHTIGDWLFIMILLLNYGLYYQQKEMKTWNVKVLRKAISVVLIVCCLFGVVYFCYMTFITNDSATNSFSSYFQFRDSWGTGRGFVWRKCIEAFKELPIHQKLFGYGLDTTSTLLYNTFFDESLLVWDAAHNEYLQYLISGGICFLLSYLFVIYHSLKKMFSTTADVANLCWTFAIFAYCIQAAVNIAQPITTPILFIMLGIIESYHRGKEQ